MPPKRPASPTVDDASLPSKVFISESIHDRKSTFVGYYAHHCTKPKELQIREDVRSASHKILAWRLPSNQKTLLSSSRPIFKTGHDDDGENWAGRKIEKIMEELEVQGVIMVARWYGGELLGPARFTHIETAAKNAVDAWRSATSGGVSKKSRLDGQIEQEMAASSEKPMRPEELQRRKREIIQTLQRRDESIAALRTLLEQKKSAADPKLPQPAVNASPGRTMNYELMPFNRLQPLENARDMTIGFLLKEIDKAEAESNKRQEEAAQEEKSAAALKAEQDDLELDEAWAEMEDAMKEAARVVTDEAEPNKIK
jgi:hypothetical protein